MFCRILWDGTARITAFDPSKTSLNELEIDSFGDKKAPGSALE